MEELKAKATELGLDFKGNISKARFLQDQLKANPQYFIEKLTTDEGPESNWIIREIDEWRELVSQNDKECFAPRSLENLYYQILNLS